MWNTNVIILLKDVSENSKKYKIMHEEEAQHYKQASIFWQILYTITLTFIITLSGSSMSIFLSAGNSEFILLFNGLIIILEIINTIIWGYREIKQFPMLIRDHKINASEFSAITTSIRLQLALSPEHRTDSKDFITEIINRYNTVISNSIEIRETTYKRCSSMLSNELNLIELNTVNIDDIEMNNSKEEEIYMVNSNLEAEMKRLTENL